MSFQAVEAARTLRGVSPTDKLMLLVLGSYAGMDNGLWPSQRLLSEDTGLSDRAVRSALTRLEAGGFITREKRYVHGSRTTDWITLIFIPAPAAGMGRAIPESRDRHTGTSRRSNRQQVPGNSHEESEKSAREASAGEEPGSRASAEDWQALARSLGSRKFG